MATWQVIAGGTTYNLSDRTPFDVVTVTGVGSAPVRRMSQRGPLQHGETDIGYRLDPRSINLVLAFAAASLSAADTHRDTLARIFRPSDSPIQLRYTRDDSAVRQIDCYAVGMVDMPVTVEERVGVFQRVAIQLVAPDPLWYDPSINTALLSLTPPDVFGGGGVIPAGVIKATALSPATNAAVGTGTLPNTPVTIFVRTTLPTATGYAFNLRASDPNLAYHWGWLTTPIGRIKIWDFAYDNPIMSGGLHNYFFVISSPPSVHIYEDSTLKVNFNGPFNSPANIDLALSQWNLSWNQTITHAAVYSVALTLEQRNAIAASVVTDYELSGSIVNAGFADDYPVIEFTGPIADPKLTNISTGEKLDFTGATIDAGEIYTVDTRYGRKTVTDNLGANQIALLTSDSDLATFHLMPGTNLLTLSGSDTTAASGVNIAGYDRYLSL